MASTQCLTNSFLTDLFEGVHDFTTDTIKVALYVTAATLGATTTAYTATDEVSGGGYTAGGATISGIAITSESGMAYLNFDDTSWASASFTANYALIYNSSKSNASIAVLDFGAGVQAVNDTFTIEWPAASANTAIIRVGYN